jgi:hypothetical protein
VRCPGYWRSYVRTGRDIQGPDARPAPDAREAPHARQNRHAGQVPHTREAGGVPQVPDAREAGGGQVPDACEGRNASQVSQIR